MGAASRRADGSEQQLVGMVDDLVQRPRPGKHGHSPRARTPRARDVRHRQGLQHLAGAVMGAGSASCSADNSGACRAEAMASAIRSALKRAASCCGGTIDDLRAEPLLVAQHLLGRRLQIPYKAEPGQRPQQVIGRVDLPPSEALPDARFGRRGDCCASPRPW